MHPKYKVKKPDTNLYSMDPTLEIRELFNLVAQKFKETTSKQFEVKLIGLLQKYPDKVWITTKNNPPQKGPTLLEYVLGDTQKHPYLPVLIRNNAPIVDEISKIAGLFDDANNSLHIAILDAITSNFSPLQKFKMISAEMDAEGKLKSKIEDQYLLFIFILHLNVPAVRLLLQKYPNTSYEGLHDDSGLDLAQFCDVVERSSGNKNKLQEIRRLLTAGNVKTSMHQSIADNLRFVSKNAEWIALTRQIGQLDDVDASVTINHESVTLLHAAIFYLQPLVVIALLNKNASIYKLVNGKNVLHRIAAIKEGDNKEKRQTLELILNRAVKDGKLQEYIDTPTSTNSAVNAVEIAVFGGNFELAKLLLEKGASVDIANLIIQFPKTYGGNINDDIIDMFRYLCQLAAKRGITLNQLYVRNNVPFFNSLVFVADKYPAYKRYLQILMETFDPLLRTSFESIFADPGVKDDYLSQRSEMQAKVKKDIINRIDAIDSYLSRITDLTSFHEDKRKFIFSINYPDHHNLNIDLNALINSRNVPYLPPLFLAAGYSSADLLRWFLQHKVDVNQHLHHGYLARFNLNYTVTPLVMAIQRQDNNKVRELLKYPGVQCDIQLANHIHLLSFAVFNNLDEDIIETIFEKLSINNENYKQYLNCLYIALINPSRYFQFLFDRLSKFDPALANHVFMGRFPLLYLSIICGSEDAVRCLLANQANVNILWNGHRLFEYAVDARVKSEDILLPLLRCNVVADLTEQNKFQLLLSVLGIYNGNIAAIKIFVREYSHILDKSKLSIIQNLLYCCRSEANALNRRLQPWNELIEFFKNLSLESTSSQNVEFKQSSLMDIIEATKGIRASIKKRVKSELNLSEEKSEVENDKNEDENKSEVFNEKEGLKRIIEYKGRKLTLFLPNGLIEKHPEFEGVFREGRLQNFGRNIIKYYKNLGVFALKPGISSNERILGNFDEKGTIRFGAIHKKPGKS